MTSRSGVIFIGSKVPFTTVTRPHRFQNGLEGVLASID
jgi:hypothetical protein